MNYERLKYAIAERGYTQKAFGEKIGYSKNGINNLMNGHTKMDNIIANLIVEVLELSEVEALQIFFPRLSQKWDERSSYEE